MFALHVYRTEQKGSHIRFGDEGARMSPDANEENEGQEDQTTSEDRREIAYPCPKGQSDDLTSSLKCSYTLNESQKRVVNSFLWSALACSPDSTYDLGEAAAARESSVFLVLGPPGTGKSQTLLALLEATQQLNAGFRVLFSAPSNKAVVNGLKKFDFLQGAIPNNGDASIALIGNEARLHEVGSGEAKLHNSNAIAMKDEVVSRYHANTFIEARIKTVQTREELQLFWAFLEKRLGNYLLEVPPFFSRIFFFFNMYLCN